MAHVHRELHYETVNLQELKQFTLEVESEFPYSESNEKPSVSQASAGDMFLNVH